MSYLFLCMRGSFRTPRNQMSEELMDICENAKKSDNTGLRLRPSVTFLSQRTDIGMVNRTLSCWPTMHRRTRQTRDPTAQKNAAHKTLRNAPSHESVQLHEPLTCGGFRRVDETQKCQQLNHGLF